MSKRTAEDEVSMLDFGNPPKKEPLIRRAIKAAADTVVRRPSPAEEAAYARAKRQSWSNGAVHPAMAHRKREEEEE
jgi:hypothetical protein